MYELWTTTHTYLDAYETIPQAQAAAIAFGAGDYTIEGEDDGDVPGGRMLVRVDGDGVLVDISDRDARD